MKVVVFNSHVFWPSHYETELEIIQNHLEKGDTVTQIYCDAQLPNCDINPFMSLAVCDECNRFRKQGYTAIPYEFEKIKLPSLTEEEKKLISQIPYTFSSVEEAQALQFEGLDIGYAVLSSVISILRNPKPDFDRYQTMIKDYITGSAAIFLIFKRWLNEHKPDLVYAFNGRLAHTKPVLRACQQLQIECRIHERGAIINKYSLSENTTPHDLQYVKRRIIETWENVDNQSRVAIAEEFFKAKVEGLETSWASFTKDQVKELPPDWDSSKKNIVIFNSSEDEFVSLGKEWKNTIYNAQLEGIRKIVADLQNQSGIHFYLRIHPNLKNADNSDKNELYNIQAENLSLIPAESSVSTYYLMFHADIVLTFGSSTGIEAAFWGKPSVLAGKTLYQGLGSVYQPETHQEIIQLLKSDLKPRDKTGALMFGYYYRTLGIPYRFYAPDDYKSGKINGMRLNREKPLSAKLKDFFYTQPLLKPLSERVYYKMKQMKNRKFRNDVG